jgi:hypothetical protein
MLKREHFSHVAWLHARFGKALPVLRGNFPLSYDMIFSSQNSYYENNMKPVEIVAMKTQFPY